MFKALPSGSRIEVDPARVVSFQQSLNNSPVALNGPMVHARAYIIGVYNDVRGTYSLYVSLKPTTRGSEGVLFSCDPREVPLANYRDAEQAALDLVEGHGFVMEAVDFKRLGMAEIHQFMAEASIQPPTVQEGPQGQVPVVPLGDMPASGGGEGRYGGPSAPSPSPLSWESSSTFVGMPSAMRGQDISQAGSYQSGVSPRANISSHRQNIYTGEGPPASRPPRGETVRSPPSHQPLPGVSVSATHQNAQVGDLGMPPEEAIAMLGRLLAIF